MRNIIIFTCFVIAQATSLMGSNVTFAQEKQTAALAPMGALGELDEIEKRIILYLIRMMSIRLNFFLIP